MRLPVRWVYLDKLDAGNIFKPHCLGKVYVIIHSFIHAKFPKWAIYVFKNNAYYLLDKFQI